MSTRVRYLMKYGGTWYYGSQVKNYLRELDPLAKTFLQMKAVTSRIGGTLWVLREPRSVSRMRSRYKKTCWALGLGRVKYKPAHLHLNHGDLNHGAQPVPGGIPNGIAEQGPAVPVGQAGGLGGLAAAYQGQPNINQFFWDPPPPEAFDEPL